MDIFNITKSKTRKAILQLYFLHPEKKYYLRELEKILLKPVIFLIGEHENNTRIH